MAEVVKSKWYPAPPPALEGEPDDAYTARLASLEYGPYDHVRKRECAIGYHRTCSDRNIAHPVQYRGACGCPCHTDDATLVGEESIREVVEILCDVYSLPNRTGWHVVHFVDTTHTGFPGTTLELVRTRLGREYGSEISEGFAVDVVNMLANKGPKGAARAFWKRVYTEYQRGQKLLSMVKPPVAPEPPAAPGLTLSDMVLRAIEGVKSDPFQALPEWAEPKVKPIRLIDLGPEWQDHPRYGEVLRAQLSTALADLGWLAPAEPGPPSLLGGPIKVDPSLPPGTWKFRSADGVGQVRNWPRVTVPGVETLSHALDRLGSQDPPPPLYTEGQIAEFLKDRDLGQFISSMNWFRSGLDLIQRLRMATPSLPPLTWLLPPDVLPPGSPSMTQLYSLPVRYAEGIRPHLAFELKEITK